MSRRMAMVMVALAAALAGVAAAVPAAAATQVVRISDVDVRTFATASLADQYVRMQPRQLTDLQRWSIDSNLPTTGSRVVNVATKGCLGVSPTIPIVEGSPVTQHPCRNHSSDLWRLVMNSTDRTVRFVNVYSGLCMTIPPSSAAPLLRTYRCAGTVSQQFRLVTT